MTGEINKFPRAITIDSTALLVGDVTLSVPKRHSNEGCNPTALRKKRVPEPSLLWELFKVEFLVMQPKCTAVS